MTNLVALVLSVVLNAADTNVLASIVDQRVKYCDIPMVKKETFDVRITDGNAPPEEVESTCVYKVDFDGDGLDEWMVCNYFISTGAGGDSRSIFRKTAKGWKEINAFHGFYKFIKRGKGHGLLVGSGYGEEGDTYTYDYYEFEKGKLKKKFSIEATYNPSGTTGWELPINIKIHY